MLDQLTKEDYYYTLSKPVRLNEFMENEISGRLVSSTNTNFTIVSCNNNLAYQNAKSEAEKRSLETTFERKSILTCINNKLVVVKRNWPR